MSRGFSDETLFDQAAYVRRKLDREDVRRRGRELLQAEAELEARIAESCRRYMIEANRRAIREEYRRHGVDPVKLGGDGEPTCSLSMLFKMGRRIEDDGDKRILVGPPR